MLVWFFVIAILGAIGIGRAPHVIVAVNPLYAASFLIHHGAASLAVLGAVFLCVTGAVRVPSGLCPPRRPGRGVFWRSRRGTYVRGAGTRRRRADPGRLDGNRV